MNALSVLTALRPKNIADIALAGLVVGVVGLLILPLPTALLDILISANISLAVLILLIAIYVKDGLGFTSFPTILLITTLYRLALNVSSTRLILLQADAGEVIRSFGEFVVRGNFVVGAVIFFILTIIQFLVIAKGSERVAEVGARFTLDAMPGKQMSIDAELRSGAISQDIARSRRRQLQRESQFYGAMDGAMKFVKGDAIAGIVITIVNIVGGLAIGVAMRDMSAADAIRRYGILTIGDGLVSQIPALLISTAAGIVVTRVASEDEKGSLGTDVTKQIFGSARPLAIGAIFVALLSIVPGMPTLPFLVCASIMGALAWNLARPIRHGASSVRLREKDEAEGLYVGDAAPTVAVKICPSLFESDPARKEQSAVIRKNAFEKLGVPLPPIVFELHETREENSEISIRGVVVATVRATGDDFAKEVGTVLERNAAKLLGYQETQALVDAIEKTEPALVRNVVPRPVPLPTLVDVLCRLLQERVSILRFREILEALAMHAATERDSAVLTELVRVSLKESITAQFAPLGQLEAITLDPEVETAIRDSVRRTQSGSYLALSPDLAREFLHSLKEKAPNPAPVIITQADIRRFVRKLVETEFPSAQVLSYQELLPQVEVRAHETLKP